MLISMLIYIHGFNSAPDSFKARLVGERMRALGRERDYQVPQLPHRPQAAIALLRDLVRAHPGAALIGSSLGGYYATHLAELDDQPVQRVVLVNPAVRPYTLLHGSLGPQKNLYTGAVYQLTAQHLSELQALEVATITPARYLLLARSGDEVLDYRDAVERYRGAQQRIIAGGDHGFSDFADSLDEVLAFCGITTTV